MKSNQNELNEGRTPTARHAFKLGMLPLVLLMACTACKKDGKVVADTNPAGTYALVSVDGKAVPCELQHEGHTMGVKSGSFIINPEGTCSSKILVSGRDAAIEVKATYKQNGSKLTMKWERAGMTTGTVEGDIFTMVNEGMSFLYRKQT
jgi:hypothetical protein